MPCTVRPHLLAVVLILRLMRMRGALHASAPAIPEQMTIDNPLVPDAREVRLLPGAAYLQELSAKRHHNSAATCENIENGSFDIRRDRFEQR